MPKMTKKQAYNKLKKAGIDFKKTTYQQKTSVGYALTELAHKTGYRAPPNAKASTGVYFFYHLKKLKEKGKI